MVFLFVGKLCVKIFNRTISHFFLLVFGVGGTVFLVLILNDLSKFCDKCRTESGYVLVVLLFILVLVLLAQPAAT